MRKVNWPPMVIVQTLVVADVKVTARLDDADAVSVGVVPNVCAPGDRKSVVWGKGVDTGGRRVIDDTIPAEFVAVTVNV